MIKIAFENVNADKLARLKAFSNEQGIRIVSISDDFTEDSTEISETARQRARNDFFNLWKDVPLEADDVDNLVRKLRKNRFQEMFDAR